MSFLAPALLVFLLLLPGLLWLVKATPPQPRTRHFSSLLLLGQLSPNRHDAAHTPLWLLLLRLSAVTLVILTFSRPIWLQRHVQPSPSDLIIVLDNGWAATPHWEARRTTADTLGEKTLRQGGHVTLLLTARSSDGHWPEPFHPRDAQALGRFLHSLQPQPWPVERASLAAQLSTPSLRDMLQHASLVFLSDGLAQQGEASLQHAIAGTHDVREIRWPRCDLMWLKRQSSSHASPSLLAETLPHCPSRPLTLNGLSLDDHAQFSTLAHWSIQTGRSTLLTLPTALAPSLDAVSTSAIPAPAGIFLFTGGHHQRPVGILHLGGDEAPLTGSAFYLSHAMSKSASVQSGDIKSVLSTPLSLLIAPDGTLSEASSQGTALSWVRQGGVLIRFAGTELAHREENAFSDTEKSLLPVPVLHGMRQLGGPMSWGAPQELAPFPEHSPFAGLPTPRDVTVTRQVLAKPTNDLQDHVWATLKDGTPLVTARHEGHGLVVLFHTTPTADWSTLPLSGLFPRMLERLVMNAPALAHSAPHSLTPHAALPPWKMLTQQGTLAPTTSGARPLDSVHPSVSAIHPAGLYGTPPQLHPLNLAENTPPMQDEPSLGLPQSPDLVTPDWPVWPLLGGIAFLLLLADLVCSLARQGALSFIRLTVLAGFLAATGSMTGAAEASPAPPPPAALEIRLAHILTGDAPTDEAAQQGLEGLTRFVNHRSTAHLGAPVGVTAGRDDLAFYPLIYWPILPSSQTSPAQNAALNSYMHHGGLLFIDEMGAGSTLDSSDGNATRKAIKRVTAELDIPPLTTIDDHHTLSHAFYLLHDYPGRVSGQPVYVARFGDEEGENVSPVIIGNADWSHAWAIDHAGNPPYAVIPDGDSQRTLAYRFGFNTVIYALTGNYKNDQRHYPEMLHRLKSDQDDTSPSENEGGPE